MKKICNLIFVLFLVHYAYAQSFNNEWIDYSKTYYKFKVGATGFYRIQKSQLPAALQNTPVENFVLWRNGSKVPVYTSVASGVLPNNGYIEFWGEMNDGKPDKALYRFPANQLTDKHSFQTDTAAFFLADGGAGSGLKLTATVNDVAGNTLPAEPFFMYSLRKDFKDQINKGKALYYGEYVYSSTYDVGEFWASADIYPASPAYPNGTPVYLNTANTYAAPSGPSPTLRIAAAGNSILGGTRRVKVSVNGNVVMSEALGQLDAKVFINNGLTLSAITGAVSIRVADTVTSASQANDRIVCGFIELTYPRLFNFGNAANFEFQLEAAPAGNYLEISNFNFGGTTPVLLDLTNGKRYEAVVSGSVLQFKLQPSPTARKLVLVSAAPSNVLSISGMVQRNFINLSSASEQGNYLIISNKIITSAQDYADYRSSAPGGSFRAKVYDIDELVDQFAFGIKKHPLSVKNFIRWAKANFSTALQPKYALIIGKAVVYTEYRSLENHPDIERQNLVPTFGWPASDVMLASADLYPVPSIPIGRLSVVKNEEVLAYLEKIKIYESQQSNPSQSIADKAWMKNVIHVAGGNSPSLDNTLEGYFNNYENILKDSLFGAKVQRFSKATTGPVSLITDALMEQKINEGVSIINYFGHSSAEALDYSLNTPSAYNNTGKYPIFIVNGCNAGNNFSYDINRFSKVSSLAENWILTPNRGSIAFIASSHFGVTNYLDILNQTLYRSLGYTRYNQPIGLNITDTDVLLTSYGNSSADGTGYYLHAEQNILNGDPFLKPNGFDLPDYAIEESKIVISPSIVSVADNNFKSKIYVYNLGKAVGKSVPAKDSVSVKVQRQYPNGTVEDVAKVYMKPPVRNVDSLEMNFPIIPLRDKGENKIIVTIDEENKYTELAKLNNKAEKTFVIIEDELKPVYPYNYSIVSQLPLKLYASTANPVNAVTEYRMELDTTELFNSPLKKSFSITSIGGAIEFDATAFPFTDSTVYYWRTAMANADGTTGFWNNSSFVYLQNGGDGFGEKHYYQFKKNTYSNLNIDDSRQFVFPIVNVPVSVQHGHYPPNDWESSYVRVKNTTVATWSNAQWSNTASPYHFGALEFVVLNGKTLEAFENTPANAAGGKYGSLPSNENRHKQFGFYFTNQAERYKIADFMDTIPNGYYVIVYSQLWNTPDQMYDFVNVWKNDPGPNSLYQKFIQHGLSAIDSFTFNRPFIFMYKKNDPSFTPRYVFGSGDDLISLNQNVDAYQTDGQMASPVFGPASKWQTLQWNGKSVDTVMTDKSEVHVYGVQSSGTEHLLAKVYHQADTTLNFIDAATYPFLRLKMVNKDSIFATPVQLKHWLVKGTYLPEGALAANVLFHLKDTIELGETIDFKVAFKNISNHAFPDSMKVKMIITDNKNVPHAISLPNYKKLIPGDTLVVRYTFDSKDFLGNNTMYLFVNPDGDQPESFLYNNYFYKNFFVADDNIRPVMDVTFDGVHILNNDIVSARPNVLVKLKDESKFNLLSDTSLVTVNLVYNKATGQQVVRRFAYGTDTLQFHPAVDGTDNTASVEFKPVLEDDGDYELWVKAKDRNGNPSGDAAYKVSFKVTNKPMISNMFNYPNPFTTSTAFVFTLTGAEVPQNIRIQILTITGKIVKEITKDELGPLHIGRNITEYKWNGTDQYGNPLGNGVYLYRVITNHNGSALDKFETTNQFGDKVNTDSYFNSGYGKMYLMR